MGMVNYGSKPKDARVVKCKLCGEAFKQYRAWAEFCSVAHQQSWNYKHRTKPARQQRKGKI